MQNAGSVLQAACWTHPHLQKKIWLIYQNQKGGAQLICLQATDVVEALKEGTSGGPTVAGCHARRGIP